MNVTVLLPTYNNRSDVLGFAIESVLGQTVTDLELFVVLDGCSDGSLDVVRNAASRDQRVRWWDLPKGFGSGMDNRNIALREAQGEFVAYMQHDDIWFPDHLEKLLAPMSNPKVTVTTGRAVWVSRHGRLTPGVHNLYDAIQFEQFIKRIYSRLPTNCWVHRRNVFAHIGYWPEDIERGGDLEFECRLLKYSGMVGYHGVPVETSLHFERPATAANESQFWSVLHRATGRMDDAMRLEVPDGMTAQEAARIRLGSQQSWIQEIRHACARALETCAYDLEHADVPALRRTIERLQAKLDKSLEKQEAWKDKAVKLHGKMDALIAARKSRLKRKLSLLRESWKKIWKK